MWGKEVVSRKVASPCRSFTAAPLLLLAQHSGFLSFLNDSSYSSAGVDEEQEKRKVLSSIPQCCFDVQDRRYPATKPPLASACLFPLPWFMFFCWKKNLLITLGNSIHVKQCLLL
ncbi:Hypothetical predicted protein [Podarcis lilfordi]|uniref:Uncharacterized protein n=1 Tax=Podarcis lilfordi TaxID=74358 RepID=A0AA35NW65_9SAUR|nr:Hypothetical predicted protein [Podarcis lilfordi]